MGVGRRRAVLAAATAAALAAAGGCGGGGSAGPASSAVPPAQANGGMGSTGDSSSAARMIGGAGDGGSAVPAGAPILATGAAAADVASPAGGRVYKGTATTTLDYVSGSGQTAMQWSYQRPVEVIVAPPLVSDAHTEGNPVHLIVEPDSSSDPTQVGQIQIRSAQVFPDPTNRGRGLIQYWALRQDGSQLSGSLTDPHADASQAVNTLNAMTEVKQHDGLFLLLSCVIDSGATLSGTVDDGQVQLRIAGAVTGNRTDHPFVTVVTARRAG